MSEHIDTSDGTWREVSPEEWASNTDRDSLRAVVTGGGLRHWLREDPVPPLPTEPYTVISVEWRSEYQRQYRPMIVTLMPEGLWYEVGARQPVLAAQLLKQITGWKPLAVPVQSDDTLAACYKDGYDTARRVTAQAVIGTFGAQAFSGLLSVADLCWHARTVYDLLGEDEEPFDLASALSS